MVYNGTCMYVIELHTQHICTVLRIDKFSFMDVVHNKRYHTLSVNYISNYFMKEKDRHTVGGNKNTPNQSRSCLTLWSFAAQLQCSVK